MKLVKIGYYTHFLVPEYLLPQFVQIMGEISLKDGDKQVPVSFEVEVAPNMDVLRLKEEARAEVKDTLVKEMEQYKGWWLTGNAKVQKLEAELKEAKDTVGKVNDAVGQVKYYPDDKGAGKESNWHGTL